MILLDLSPREWDVLMELCKDGVSNRLIARRLFVTEDTVKTHIKSLLRRGGFHTRTELAVAVLRWEVALACRLSPRQRRP